MERSVYTIIVAGNINATNLIVKGVNVMSLWKKIVENYKESVEIMSQSQDSYWG